jgi:CheY-like chemotaxis protein
MKVEHRMQWTKPIMIIEDDADDQELLQEAFSTLDYPNTVIFFSNGNDALNYLDQTSVPPVLIISDINMPKINGFELRERINRSQALRKLDIPFVFLSTLSQKEAVANAGSVPDLGFFTKPNSMNDLRNTIKTIVEYWCSAVRPLFTSDKVKGRIVWFDNLPGG